MKIDALFADEIISRAKAEGADQAEVFIRSSGNLTVEVRGQEIDSLKYSHSFGYSLRVIAGKRLGFSYATEIRDADTVVRRAIESARYADPDEYLGLPEEGGQSRVDVFDPALEAYPEEAAIGSVMRIEQSALETDHRIRKVRKASGSFSSSETFIVSSESVRVGYSSTSCSAQITVIAEDGSDSQMGWDFDGSRHLGRLSFEEIGRNAAKRAVALLGPRKLASRKTNVLLDSSVAVDFLGILAASFSSEAVQKGRSLLAGRAGDAVISNKIHIIDSGVLDAGLGSSPADAEGVATAGKVIVSGGVLREYLYNTYTARKAKTRSTGNAVRGGFASLPGVGVSNLYLESASPSHIVPGDRLFSFLDTGLYVIEGMGVHTANPVSGDFSIGVTGLWVERGVVQHPVKEAAISGNVLDLFRKIQAIGDDLRFYGSVGSPSLIISGVDISG